MSLLKRWIDLTAPIRERFSARARGVFVALLGGLLVWWQIAVPIEAAREGVVPFTFYPLIATLGLVLLATGLVLVVLGDRGERHLESSPAGQIDYQNLNPRQVLLLIAIAVPLGAFTLWFGSYVEALARQQAVTGPA